MAQAKGGLEAAAQIPRPDSVAIACSRRLKAALLDVALSIPIVAAAHRAGHVQPAGAWSRMGAGRGLVLPRSPFACAYLVVGLSAQTPAGRKKPAACRVRAVERARRADCRVGGLILLALYPFLALALAGQAGSIKWIDNFGIQIMIYIMLGWGLEYRRRPGRPARSRLRRLLCGRRLFLRAACDRGHPGRSRRLVPGRSGSACRSPVFWPPSGASCSAFPCCACAATISPL